MRRPPAREEIAVPESVRTAPTVRRLCRRPAAALMALSLASLVACGSDDDPDEDVGSAATTTNSAPTSSAPESSESPSSPSEPTSSPSESEAGAQEVTIAAVDFDYELPTTEFQAGELTIELVNEGQASHNIVVERDGEDVAGTDVIDPGETATLEVTLEPGEYIFYCGVGNHRAMGMEVMVTVT
jgi:plastocyanin